MLLVAASALAAPLTPHFGWTVGDTWDVSYSEEIESTETDRASVRIETRAHWTLRVEGRPGALLLRATNYQLDELPNADQATLATRYASAIDAIAPAARLDPTLQVVELLDPSAARASADALLTGDDGALSPKAAKLQAQRSDAARLRELRGWWDDLVATWSGRTLDPATPFRRKVSFTLPLLSVVIDNLDQTGAWLRNEPCAPGEAPACELLELQTLLTGDAVAPARARLSERWSADEGTPIEVESLDLRSSARLLTEADDLRPRSFVIEDACEAVGLRAHRSFTWASTGTRRWTFHQTAVGG